MSSIDYDITQQTTLEPQKIIAIAGDNDKAIKISKDGIKIEYDRTTAVKTFELNKDGVYWTDGITPYNTTLGRLCAVQQAFQAVELPPNATTLKLNDTLLCDNGTATTSVSSTSIAMNNPASDIVGSITGNGFNLTTDATGSGVGTSAVNASAINSAGTLQSSLSGSVVGMPSPPYPAPDANFSLSVNSTTNNPSLYLSKSAPFTNSTSMTIDLNNIIHNQSTGSPSPDDNFTISTNKNLILTADNIDLSDTGRLLIPNPLTTNNHLDYNAGKLTINNVSVGGTANPLLVLQNKNNTAGSVAIETYKNKATGAVNDTIANWSMYANDFSGNKVEFARINSTITNSSAGAGNDGAVNIWASVNGTISNVFTFNGADNENNTFRPLDLTGNDLKTSSGNMLINALASTGTGNITISPKTTLTLNSPLTPIQATNTIQMATDKQILLFDSSPNVVATTLGNGEVVVDDITGLSRTQHRPTDFYVIDTNTGDNTSYSLNGFSKSDNSIQCNSNNGLVLSTGVNVNTTTLNLSKMEIYNATAGTINDTILLQNTGGGNPVFNLNSFDANTGDTSQMGASVSGVGLNYQNQFFQTKNLSMNNPVGSAGVISYTNTLNSDNLIIASNNTSLELNTANALVLNGSSLLDTNAGGTSGQHLVLTINGNQYKIALLNP